MSTKTAYLYLLYTLIYSLTFAYVLLVTNYTPYTTRTNNLYIYIYINISIQPNVYPYVTNVNGTPPSQQLRAKPILARQTPWRGPRVLSISCSWKYSFHSRNDSGSPQYHGDSLGSPGWSLPRRGGDPDDLHHAELCGSDAGLGVQWPAVGIDVAYLRN